MSGAILNNWHRYYDARVGGYISSDPIGLQGGMNTYTYAGNNPVSYVDPTGLIDLKVNGVKDGVTFHANPGPDATTFRPEHNPAHVHLGANDGPRVDTVNFKPLAEKDARAMTKEQKKACGKLNADQKNTIRSRQQSVFKNGKYILQGLAGPAAFSPYAYCQSDLGRCIDTIENIKESF